MKKFKSLSSSLFSRPHFLSFCLFLAFCFLIFSCNVFSPSIRHYLSKYSQNIIVKDFIPAGDYQIDKNGNLCIPSEGNNYFTLFYANPADHSFQLQYFDNSTPWTVIEGGEPISYDSLTFSVNNKADLNYLNLFFEESSLKKKEKDGDTKVSLNFKLVDRTNGETIEKTLSFVINTPPYIFQGEPVFGSLGTQAVLCLNFAKYSDNPIIWNDFCTQENGKTVFVIKINNEDYKFELNKSNDTILYIGSNNSGTLLTENHNSIVLNTGIFTQNSNSIYFAFDSDISSFTVIAEDSAGLKVEYKINSSSFEKILYVANVPKSSNHSGFIKDPANLQNVLDFLKGKNGEWTIRIMEDLIQDSSDSHFASIDLSTNSDYPSTITIEGYNGIKTIDGNKKSSIFKFTGITGKPDFTVILKNLIMQNGKQKENSGLAHGGGIYCIHMNLKMYNCEVKKNSTPSWGGGLYFSMGSLELNNCKINDNSCADEGGGIFSYNSSLIISNTEINNNYASSTGGGIYYKITDTNTYISRLTNCTISKNTSDGDWGYGGGLYLKDSYSSFNTKFYCTNCSINKNSSKNRGAGFYVYSIKLILSTCSIKNNSVRGLPSSVSNAGAGIYCTSLNCLQYTSDTQIENNEPGNVFVEN
jgi:hypothetical protein